MAAKKSERLMNLVIALLVTRQYLSKERVRAAVEGYREQSDDAFDRMFERDKDELRELGIEIEMGSNDKYFDDEPGYRIKRDDFELGDIDLTTEEAAVVGLAARVWDHAGLAGESSAALVKLKAAGIEVDTSALTMAEPSLSANEPSFDTMWEAATRRIPVRFTYARPGREAAERHLQPWGVVSWRGRWYVVGHDLDRDAERVFRLGRVQGDAVFDGRPGAYEVPEGTDLKAIARTMFSDLQPTATATVRVRRDRAQSLRRRAVAVREVDPEHDELDVTYGSPWQLAGEIASFGPDAVAVSPDVVRDATVAMLRGLAGERVA